MKIKTFPSKLLRIFYSLGIFLFLNSCSNSVLEPADQISGVEYFPIQFGNFVEYDVREIQFRATQEPIDQSYQLREEIGESFRDLEGNLSYFLNRFRRDNELAPWVLDSLWVIKQVGTRGIRVENNQTFIKLVFPPENALTWDGNLFNTFDKEDYTIENFGQDFTVDSTVYTNTLMVNQNNLCSLVSLDRRNEVFAPDIGMIYREIWQVNFRLSSNTACIDQIGPYCDFQDNAIQPELPPESCIEFGKIITQKIIRHGSN